jgi:drug/metabolite transporter (DMT)-like permease
MKWVLVMTVVLSTSASDLLKSLGMREYGEVRDFRPRALTKSLIATMQSPLILASLLGNILAFVSFIALLSVAELSFAVPATASALVLETICAKILLHESVSWHRWIGVAFIACGVVLLSR